MVSLERKEEEGFTQDTTETDSGSTGHLKEIGEEVEVQ